VHDVRLVSETEALQRRVATDAPAEKNRVLPSIDASVSAGLHEKLTSGSDWQGSTRKLRANRSEKMSADACEADRRLWRGEGRNFAAMLSDSIVAACFRAYSLSRARVSTLQAAQKALVNGGCTSLQRRCGANIPRAVSAPGVYDTALWEPFPSRTLPPTHKEVFVGFFFRSRTL